MEATDAKDVGDNTTTRKDQTLLLASDADFLPPGIGKISECDTSLTNKLQGLDQIEQDPSLKGCNPTADH